MSEVVSVHTYEYGVVTGELVKIADDILHIKLEDGTIIKILK